jgi:3-oxoacyl-[acyl-carrier-protein] synthase II
VKPIAVVANSMITPLGRGADTLDALFEGRSGFAHQPSTWNLRNTLTAVVGSRPASPDEIGRWQRDLATSVLSDVLGTVEPDHRQPQGRCVFVFATSYGHLLDSVGDETMSTWAKDCLRSLEIDTEPVVVGSGCSSGADAVGVAAAMLDCEMVDAAVVVAVDVVTESKRLAHSTLGTMTTGRHRPFDKNRSGMLLGEAATAVTLRRSMDVPVHEGELIGVGASNDAFGLTAPDPSGLSIRLALDRALGAAGLSSGDLALYFAHATGTQLNDALEAQVVAEVFADNAGLAVVGTKGALGHSLGACGLLEFVLLLQMLNRGSAPPTVGLCDPLAGIAGRTSGVDPRPLAGPCGVSMTLGFGGFNTALIARGRGA